MRDEIMIVTTADHPVMDFVRTCESDPKLFWIDLKDTAAFEYIFDRLIPYSAVLAVRRCGMPESSPWAGHRSPASFAAAMAREGAGLAFTYRSCRVLGDHFRHLRIGKEGIFLDLALAWPAGKYRPLISGCEKVKCKGFVFLITHKLYKPPPICGFLFLSKRGRDSRGRGKRGGPQRKKK